MALREISFEPCLDTSTADLIREFYVPALRHSTRYDRGVGYFSSSWLRLAAAGLVGLARNGGEARMIASPILDADDWGAIQRGAEARTHVALHEALRRTIDELEHDLDADTLSAVAWMVADGLLELRLAVPTLQLGGDFHDKFGIFTDVAGSQVAFHGSQNDSLRAFENYESIDIFCSWDGRDAHRVRRHAARFERIWTGADPNVRVFSLPEAIRAQLAQLRTRSERPYALRPRLVRPALPPTLDLREHQRAAIAAWVANDHVGLVEMATGTGKTFTALAAAVSLAREPLGLVIAVPYTHLIDQWAIDAAAFGLRPVRAFEGQSTWRGELATQINEFHLGARTVLSVLTTHATLASEPFRAELARFRGRLLFIADEVHHLGAPHLRTGLLGGATYRLGLSATWERAFDPAGTDALLEYFRKVVYCFNLADALNATPPLLTPYEYHPVLVELTDDEMADYRDLSRRIARAWHIVRGDLDDESLRALLIRRARVLNDAEGKVVALRTCLRTQPSLSHALVYCEPDSIDRVVRAVSEEGLLLRRFTAEESPAERREILEAFSSGEIQVLVAMRCLDEGVDVPATRLAFILASSSNPRQFIQRRGRILRRHPTKSRAVLYDFIAAPPPPTEGDAFDAEQRILRRELGRVHEFASLAVNEFAARAPVLAFAQRFGIETF